MLLRLLAFHLDFLCLFLIFILFLGIEWLKPDYFKLVVRLLSFQSQLSPNHCSLLVYIVAK